MRTQDKVSLDFRSTVRPDDRLAVRRLVESTGFFRPDEVDVAEELVTERLLKGPASGYEFLFADQEGQLRGYVCFGPIPCTVSSWDLYWIVVDPAYQRQGLGRQLLREAEKAIRAAGGTRVYVDTSGREQYQPTRQFYEKNGYRVAAVLEDFYAPGDAKVIYVKVLTGTGNSGKL
ncbi:Histone acetyltransferase HPA2-related acetyltransferase [Thermogutta terrifontis]|uniref:Histone acetyltransferase HPA2-related acetyltransferase n=1 Tax=Thermogutta terrifontis TaxID=1331910 RepID=A0A286RBF5_9BACT|nr:GNAT family N-acetyltransferase [Thermogutta terrifontis]ASV73304.1 Histone acetyltransferase HPA2-related acetyltransferase [Thermogutta terrifontis]